LLVSHLDWFIIIAFFTLSLAIGVYSSRKAGRNTGEFFLSGRSMPWWLLGVSMVATTFAADTPSLVTDIVRQHGVAGNWAWWAFLLTGMLTVFVYARLWRRSGVLTDLEFYELRYGGRRAALLRGFRALYLGGLFNIIIIATVSLALIKINAVMLGWPAWQTLLLAGLITVVYSSLGGLRGILLTDFLQFALAIGGAIAAAVYLVSLPEVGGLDKLFLHPRVSELMPLFPDFSDADAVITLLLIPLAVQWWSVWYPGAEPGGGGYIAQRMLAAKNESGAIRATLLFNLAHYALRPWPWIIVALASLIVFPGLRDLQSAFPAINADLVRHDLAYPAMLTLLPKGLLGVVLASLFAAYMSTVSTQLNWGASYLVHDFYRRFISPQATEKQMVKMARRLTLVLMLVASGLALALENALQAFNILLQVGAGTGLIYILRWFWWRINTWSEISAMLVSFGIALFWQFIMPLLPLPAPGSGTQLLISVALTTAVWLGVTWLTAAEEDAVLRRFYDLIRPAGPGWRRFGKGTPPAGGSHLPLQLLSMLFATVAIYSLLFATGYLIYKQYDMFYIFGLAACLSGGLLMILWQQMYRKEQA
jgi:SSS family solute:Na+ symporter